MPSSLARWSLLPILLISIAIWIGVSSISANAAHVWAKSNFAFSTFGTISIEVVLIAIGWAAAMGVWIILVARIAPRVLAHDVLAAAVWSASLLALCALGDEWLTGLGPWAVAVLVAELAVAAFLVTSAVAPRPFWQSAQRMAVVCAWLAAAKAVILVIAPGVAVRI
jgi:hypothetical protein